MRTLRDLLTAAVHAHPERGYRFVDDAGALTSRAFAELERATRRIAAGLHSLGVARGARALLAYPPGLDFTDAFLACAVAGVIAVPVPPPHAARLARTLPRLRAIAADCDPSIVLTTSALVPLIERVACDLADAYILATDACAADPDVWHGVAISGDDVALLQYTSGSTRDPRGVIVSHANLLHNLGLLREFHLAQEHMVMVHWLPLYHDMGLIRGMLSPLDMIGDCVMLPAMRFVEKPVRWLAAISEYRATTTGAPNFGFELCARRVTDAELATLDLSTLRIAFSTAEPVQAATIERFCTRFAACGFERSAFRPAYGLAEATVAVTGETGDGARTWPVSARALRDARIAMPAGPADIHDLVACGKPLGDQDVAIVVDGVRAPADRVGEVWIRGPSVARGYWQKPEETAAVFGGRLDGDGPFLRTGDLGWLAPDGRLCITGRIKDLIIIRGQNHYPQDIEATLEAASPALRPGCTIAFEHAERIAVICECIPDVAWSELVVTLRAAASEHHELSIGAIACLPHGEVPKTASGKLQRSLARELFLANRLAPLFAWALPGSREPIA